MESIEKNKIAKINAANVNVNGLTFFFHSDIGSSCMDCFISTNVHGNCESPIGGMSMGKLGIKQSIAAEHNIQLLKV